jgi:outer membrane cobalamin receptor
VRAEDGATPTPTTESILVTGARRRRTHAPQDPTASATVVEADRFAGEAKTVAELVATAPGVAVSQYGGLGHFSKISIRGSNANGVLVLLDGLPLNTEAGGGVDLSSIPRAWIERIEIVRGPEGASFGSGALGGAVNVVTRRAAAGAPSGEATAGSFGTLAASAEGRAGGDGGALLVAASGEASRNDFTYLFDPQPALAGSPLLATARENAATARGGVLAKGWLDLGARQLDAVLQLSAGRRELPGFPYALTPDDRQRDGRALAIARIAWPAPVDGLSASVRGHARADLLDLEQGPVVARQRDLAAGLDGDAVLDHRRGSARLALSAAGERIWGDGFGIARARATLAAAASDELRVSGALRVAPAVRVERVGEWTGWSAKLGADAPLAGPLRARASAGRTFRAPSLAELHLQQALVAPNPDLHPEVGLGADAALVAEGGTGFASAGGHVTRYDDLVVYRPATLGLKPFNSAEALVAGAELEGATAPLGRLGASLQAAYTFLFSETLRGDALTVGKELPRRPHHRLFARASVAPGPLRAHVEVHHVSSQFADDRNLGVIPAATVWSAGASARLAARPEVRVALEVRNLLDDRTLLDPIGNPLPGRTALVTVRIDAAPTPGRPTP